MHPALCDKSAAILTQHSYLREAASVQRIADLPSISDGRREREPAGGYPPALDAGYYSPYNGLAGVYNILSGERIEKNN